MCDGQILLKYSTINNLQPKIYTVCWFLFILSGRRTNPDTHTLTQAQAPGSWNAGMLEMVAVTSLQIFTFYTALENM